MKNRNVYWLALSLVSFLGFIFSCFLSQLLLGQRVLSLLGALCGATVVRFAYPIAFRNNKWSVFMKIHKVLDEELLLPSNYAIVGVKLTGYSLYFTANVLMLMI